MSQWLRVTAAVLRLGAGLTLAALAVRFAQTSVERSLRVMEARDQAEASARKAAEKPEGAPSARASAAPRLSRPPSAPRTAASRGKPQAVAPGTPIRMPVSVMIGPDRSPVYINRQKRGTVPFIGEITCSAGEPVHINVVPPQGMPLAFEKVCEKRSLRIQ